VPRSDVARRPFASHDLVLGGIDTPTDRKQIRVLHLEETDVTPLFSAGTTFKDVRIPFPHVRVAGLGARSTFEDLQRQHPTATPVIVGADGNSFCLLFDEPPTLSPKEVIERSLQGDGWCLQLGYERELHDKQQLRLKELNAPEALIRNWRPPESIDVLEIVNQTWSEPPHRPTDISCTASIENVLIVLIPTVRPWEAAAYFHFGGWNACPAPWVHVAYAREWSVRFGARLVALTHDVLEFEVSRPITSREDAVAMAAVHAHYCSDTVSSIAQHAAYLLDAPLWRFWWD
jgi:Domain of unknown function (DUF4253)